MFLLVVVHELLERFLLQRPVFVPDAAGPVDQEDDLSLYAAVHRQRVVAFGW